MGNRRIMLEVGLRNEKIRLHLKDKKNMCLHYIFICIDNYILCKLKVSTK